MIKNIIVRALISSFFRTIVGATFIVSGIIKANDSIGFSYKLEEYFQDGALAYRMHEIFGWNSFSLEWLIPYVLQLAIFICVFEIILGFALIVKAKIKMSLFFTFSMLIFFTFLTLHTATCVPGETSSGIPIQCVDDCGCFGDAMKDSIGRSLTPWESFIKDILLIIFSIPILILDRKKGLNSLFQDIPSIIFSSIFTLIWCFIFSWYFPFLFLIILFSVYFLIKKYYSYSSVIISFTALLSFLFVSHTLNNLPVMDYRPYKVGFNFKSNFDSSYEEVKINETTSLSIYDSQDNNFTNEFVNYPSVIVSSSYKFNEFSKKPFMKIKSLFYDAKKNDIKVMQICDYFDMPKVKEAVGEDSVYYYSDSDIGKIIIRSDPGILLFKNGVIIKKWHHNDIPTIDEINELLK